MCDTLCLRTKTGMVFAKNSDRPPAESQVLLAHPERRGGRALDTQYLRIPDTGAFAHIASHPTWLWGAEHGVNEHGVAIGNEKIWTVDDPHAQPLGLLGMDLVRLGLERGRDADDALRIMTTALAEHGQGGSGEHRRDSPYFSSFLIVDARGGWIVETSARTWAARPVGDGSSISNRISLTTDWTTASSDVVRGADFDQWRSRTIPTSIADGRLAATRACVARRSLGPTGDAVAEIVATLRDHGKGPWGAPRSAVDPESEAEMNPVPTQDVTVCMHVRGHQCTTASMVVDIRTDAPRRAWACLGSPCTGLYVPFFASAVPVALSDPAQWQRFSVLRDRVENEPAALAAIRALLAPVELELWAEADAADATGTQGPRDTYAVNATATVESALEALGV